MLQTDLVFYFSGLQEAGKPLGAVGVPLYGGGVGGGGGGTFTPGGAAVGGDQYNRAAGAATTGGIGGTAVQNSVLDIIKSAMDDAGISVDAICDQLKGQFQAPEIR